MRDLLGFGRAAAAVLRLGGRWRAASIIGAVVTVAWFLFGLVSRADAYAGTDAGTYAGTDSGTVSVSVAVAVAVGLSFTVACAGWQLVCLLSSRPVRFRTFSGLPGAYLPRRRAERHVPRVDHGHELEAVTAP